MTPPLPSPHEGPIIFRAGPLDGSTSCATDQRLEITIWRWCWVSDEDTSLRYPRFGVYLPSGNEYSIIDGERHQHYVWDGWLWGAEWKG